jgi:hypothetical protein
VNRTNMEMQVKAPGPRVRRPRRVMPAGGAMPDFVQRAKRPGGMKKGGAVGAAKHKKAK